MNSGPQAKLQCCIAGGGPAGMMLGLLLARAGVRVTVLEKHADFLRDFRGDTIHPSTLEVMHELGLLAGLLDLPHQKARSLSAQVGDRLMPVADFGHLPTRCRFIAFMPQWDFLTYLAEQGRRYPGFTLLMQAEASELIEAQGRVVGLCAKSAEGPLEMRADLVIAADGRHSTLRRQAGLAVKDLGAPMDVLWFRLSRQADDPDQPLARFEAGRIFILINRGDYWQCGFVIPKASYETIRSAGLQRFRDLVDKLSPFAAARAAELRDWNDVSLLTVRVDRLRQWHRPGLLCIGDAAHAMSPIGGVGINLAIQDAVAAANLLAAPLRDGRLTQAHLHAVQRRRMLPTRVTQGLQLALQKRVVGRVLAGGERLSPPLALRLLAQVPFLRRLPARLIGLGVRPEHVTAPLILQAESD